MLLAPGPMSHRDQVQPSSREEGLYCGVGSSSVSFLGQRMVCPGEGLLRACRGGILSLPPWLYPKKGMWSCWTAGGRSLRYPHLKGLGCFPPLAFRVPRRALRTSTLLGTLLYGIEIVRFALSPSQKWKNCENHQRKVQQGLQQFPDPAKERGTLLGTYSSFRGMKKQPDGPLPINDLHHHCPISGPSFVGLSCLFCATLLGDKEGLVPLCERLQGLWKQMHKAHVGQWQRWEFQQNGESMLFKRAPKTWLWGLQPNGNQGPYSCQGSCCRERNKQSGFLYEFSQFLNLVSSFFFFFLNAGQTQYICGQDSICGITILHTP